MARTEKESEKRKEKRQTCCCCRDQRRACKIAEISDKKLEQTGTDKKERVTSASRSEQFARTLPFPKRKEKEPSVQITRS